MVKGFDTKKKQIELNLEWIRVLSGKRSGYKRLRRLRDLLFKTWSYLKTLDELYHLSRDVYIHSYFGTIHVLCDLLHTNIYIMNELDRKEEYLLSHSVSHYYHSDATLLSRCLLMEEEHPHRNLYDYLSIKRIGDDIVRVPVLDSVESYLDVLAQCLKGDLFNPVTNDKVRNEYSSSHLCSYLCYLTEHLIIYLFNIENESPVYPN